MSEYKITLPDGTTVEAPTDYEAIEMALCLNDHLTDVETLSSDEMKAKMDRELRRYSNPKI